jgi:outer membrane murein-binding lipoprotein Lpp
MTGVADEDDAVTEAANELYAVSPDEFMAKRAEVAQRLRASGNSPGAARIEKLRKPTAAAWIVNAYVLSDPSVVDQLTDLGGRLRDAQEALDAGRMRDLTSERRTLVGTLTKDAFRLAGRNQPPAGLRDEVTGTFEAAIADDDLAGRLGRLQRAEQWSGFGFAPTGAPELTLVQGGRTRTPERPQRPEKPKRSAADKRRQERALAAAQKAFDEADAAFDEARGTEQELSQEIKRLTKKLAKLQDQLDTARNDIETARKDAASARSRRREARSALDRAERDAAE